MHTNEEGKLLFINFGEYHQLGVQRLEKAAAFTDATAKSFQAILTEVGEYAKKTADDAVSFTQRATSAKAPSELVDLQTSTAKSAFEDLNALVRKVSALYVEMLREAYQWPEGELGARSEKDPEVRIPADSGPIKKTASAKQG